MKHKYHEMNTSEEATLKYGGNKYEMVLAAAQRARDIKRGHAPMIKTEYGPVVTALKEIEAGKVDRDYVRPKK